METCQMSSLDKVKTVSYSYPCGAVWSTPKYKNTTHNSQVKNLGIPAQRRDFSIVLFSLIVYNSNEDRDTMK